MKRLMIQMSLCLGLIFTGCKNETKPSEVLERPAVEATTTAPEATSTSSSLAFKDETVSKQFEAYVTLKEALVQGKPEEAAGSAAALTKLSSASSELQQTAALIENTKDLTEQRQHFATLTGQMEKAITGNLMAGSVYKQYCPMAFDNKGGYWLSESSEILNPYFGDAMLRCGSVKEIIE